MPTNSIEVHMSDETLGAEDCIPNNIPSRAFRYSTENKNLLTQKGSIYCGTGESKQVIIPGDNNESTVYTCAKTEALNPPIAMGMGTYILTCTITADNDVRLEWVRQNS